MMQVQASLPQAGVKSYRNRRAGSRPSSVHITSVSSEFDVTGITALSTPPERRSALHQQAPPPGRNSALHQQAPPPGRSSALHQQPPSPILPLTHHGHAAAAGREGERDNRVIDAARLDALRQQQLQFQLSKPVYASNPAVNMRPRHVDTHSAGGGGHHAKERPKTAVYSSAGSNYPSTHAHGHRPHGGGSQPPRHSAQSRHKAPREKLRAAGYAYAMSGRYYKPQEVIVSNGQIRPASMYEAGSASTPEALAPHMQYPTRQDDRSAEPQGVTKPYQEQEARNPKYSKPLALPVQAKDRKRQGHSRNTAGRAKSEIITNWKEPSFKRENSLPQGYTSRGPIEEMDSAKVSTLLRSGSLDRPVKLKQQREQAKAQHEAGSLDRRSKKSGSSLRDADKTAATRANTELAAPQLSRPYHGPSAMDQRSKISGSSLRENNVSVAVETRAAAGRDPSQADSRKTSSATLNTSDRTRRHKKPDQQEVYEKLLRDGNHQWSPSDAKVQQEQQANVTRLLAETGQRGAVMVMVPVFADLPEAQHVRLEWQNKKRLNQKYLVHINDGVCQGLAVMGGREMFEYPLDIYPDKEISSTSLRLINETKFHPGDFRKLLRILWFWFRAPPTTEEVESITNTLFNTLVAPEKYKKGFISYVLRLMNLMEKHPEIEAVEIYRRFLQEDEDVPPPRPCREYLADLPEDIVLPATINKGEPELAQPENSEWEETPLPKKKIVKRGISKFGQELLDIVRQYVILNVLEDAYPNSLTLQEVKRYSKFKSMDVVKRMLHKLCTKNFAVALDDNRYIRRLAAKEESPAKSPRRRHDFILVENSILNIPDDRQPTVAVITQLFCEKVAVDSMMDNKSTYTMVKRGKGERREYTVGVIGTQVVVSTKLTRIGTEEEEKVAAESNVTLLMGIFSRVEHVFLVGVGSGVSDTLDDNMCIGDVVISKATVPGQPIYVYHNPVGGKSEFKHWPWSPKSNVISRAVSRLKQKIAEGTGKRAWELYMNEAKEELTEASVSFDRPLPNPSTGRFEIMSPNSRQVYYYPDLSREGLPELHTGVIGSWDMLPAREAARSARLVKHNKLRCVDAGFQAVLESVCGNQGNSYALIRGVADYWDGKRQREWYGYSALTAAVVMKALIIELPARESRAKIRWDQGFNLCENKDGTPL